MKPVDRKITQVSLIILGLVLTIFLNSPLKAEGKRMGRESVPPEYWAGLKLWYRQPAQQWTEALPLGNGRLGAMVYGKIDEEQIQLNEDTVWTGGPYDPTNLEAQNALPEVRRLIFDGKFREAQELFGRKMMARPFNQQKYQPLGDLRLEFFSQGRPTDQNRQLSNYRRELDLDRALVTVSYLMGSVTYTREIFSSPIDQMIVVRLTADKPQNISLRVRLTGRKNELPMDDTYARITVLDGKPASSPSDEIFMVENIEPDTLVLRGRTATYLGIKGRVEYQARVKAIVENGRLSARGDVLTISGADSVTLYFTAATNFVSYKDLSADPEALVINTLEDISQKSYDRIRQDHIAEHQRLFRRVAFDLGSSETAARPTDERLKRAMKENDPSLAALYFQFGRYLLISSSRAGSQPANLQGIWNDTMNPAWGSKFTTNINLEMNYWPAQVCNLAECFEPFTKMLMDLAESGSRVAKVHYGAGGWMLHHNTDIWLAAAPVNGPYVGTWPGGGAWLSNQLWDHYAFTEDRDFLKKIYPVMKGAAQFFLDTLVEEPRHKWLVTCPSSSPENWPHYPGNPTFIDEIRKVNVNATICAGPTVDMQLLSDLFDGCIQASQILSVDAGFREKVRKTRQRLAPLQIGRHGQLQEYLEDWDDPKDQHRHLSHLYGLYPGHQISFQETPDLAAAAKKSLLFRGDGGMGWSLAWKMCLWARLFDGDQAYRLLRNQLELVKVGEGDSRKSGTYSNLFDSGPPFQIDGNFGAAAGIAEMLLQSHLGEIHILPALPSSWPTGKVMGLCARGGFEVDIAWQEGKMIRASVHSKLGKTCRIRTERVSQVTANGKFVEISNPGKNLVEFKTQAGYTYQILAGE